MARTISDSAHREYALNAMASAARAVCPVIVGRWAELDRLARGLRAAVEGSGGIIMLAGDAGIGKTRLARELGVRAEAQDVLVLNGGCSEELSLPYLPLVQALAGPLERDAGRLLDRLGPTGMELARLFPGLGLEPPPLHPQDAGGKLRLFEAVWGLLRLLADHRGLLLVVEDLHWADASTRELVEYLRRRLQKSRLCLLASYRSDELHRRHPLRPLLQAWRRDADVDLLELGPLQPEDARQMARAMPGLEAAGEELVGLVAERSEGNPFVLEEMTRVALGGGGEPGPGDLQARLPETVREAILLRLRRLEPDQVGFLRAAAVLGQAFEYEVAVVLAGVDDESALEALRMCVEHHILEPDEVDSERYRFRHALTREAVYEDIIRPERRRLHERAADVLAGRPGRPAIERGHHLLTAERWDEAVPLCLEAAATAAATHAYRDAAALYDRVLPHLPSGLERARVQCQLGFALLMAGESAGAEQHLTAGVAALHELNQPGLAGRYLLWLATAHTIRSEPALARADYEQAVADLEPLGPSEELARVHSNFATLLAMQLEGAPSIAEADKGIAVADACGAAAARIEAVSRRALGLSNIGRQKEAIAALDACADEAAAGSHFFIAAQALVNSADILVMDCRPREALDRAQRLRALPVGGWSLLRGAIREGEALSLLGEPGPALSAFEEALTLAREGGTLVHERWAERGLATVYHQLDRLDEALQLARGGRPGYRQERLGDNILAIRLLLDTGQVQRARQEAVAVVANEHELATVSLLDADTVAEALLAAGDAGGARRMANLVSADPDHPSWLSLQGRLALAEGHLEAARDHLRGAVVRYADAGACRELTRARWALATVLARLDDRTAAEAELRAALASARKRGAAYEERRTRDLLARHGVRMHPTSAQVRMALETLAAGRGLEGSPLLALERLAGAGSQRLGELVETAVAGLAASPAYREAEAGRVLRDYYLKGVGSHAVVAERLHLSRPTFYRRLHRGLELVAERLGPLDEGASRPGAGCA